MTSPTQPRNTVGAMLDALGFDRTDHDGAVRAALEKLSLLRADAERLAGELEDCQRERAQLNGACSLLTTDVERLERENEAMRADVERLRTALTEAQTFIEDDTCRHDREKTFVLLHVDAALQPQTRGER